MQRWVTGILFVLFLLGIGCGPKYAKEETLDMLEEAKLAAEKAEAKVSELEAEIADLEAKLADLEDQLDQLTEERNALKNKIETRCRK